MFLVMICTGVAVALLTSARAASPVLDRRPEEPSSRRGWTAWAPLLAGFGLWAFVGGVTGVLVGILAGIAVGGVLTRAEPPAVRRERLSAQRQLPHVVLLIATALRAGVATPVAIKTATRALPGPASDRLAVVLNRLELGMSSQAAWEAVRHDPAIGSLARTMAAASRSGAHVAQSVGHLAEELAAEARMADETRARTVGVRAALPLGLCLLPAFLLLGIVPVVAGLLSGLIQ